MENSNRKSSVSISDSYFLKVDSANSSSRSPSPNTSIKGLNLFRMISRKIGKSARKSKDLTSSDDDEDSNSSNSFHRSKKDVSECDCDYYYKNERSILRMKNRSNSFTDESYKRDKSKDYQRRTERYLRFSTPCDRYHPTSSGSEASSSNEDSSNSNDGDQPTSVGHFSSNDSSTSSSSGSYRNSRAIVRKVLKSLNLNSRSLSCSSISHMKEMPGGDRNSSKKKKSPQKILRQPVSYTYVRGISGLPTHRVVNTRACYNNQYSRG